MSQLDTSRVAASTKIEPTRRLMESLTDFFWSVATRFNPSEQPRDRLFEETSGGGRTKRVRGSTPNHNVGKELGSFRGSPLG
jgi:hypothetical protein